ncbi:MAG: helix-turn-helix domain-containing protein [Terriglobales bacterium]
MKSPGSRLRKLREQQGLTMRDVEAASRAVARSRRSRRYVVLASRLSVIENNPTIPSLQRLYTLSLLYGQSLRRLLALYGLPLRPAAADRAAIERALRVRRSR